MYYRYWIELKVDVVALEYPLDFSWVAVPYWLCGAKRLLLVGDVHPNA